MLRNAAPLLLLQPSCVLALIALTPRALVAPSAGTLGAVVVTALVALAPLALVLRALARQPA